MLKIKIGYLFLGRLQVDMSRVFADPGQTSTSNNRLGMIGTE